MPPQAHPAKGPNDNKQGGPSVLPPKNVDSTGAPLVRCAACGALMASVSLVETHYYTSCPQYDYTNPGLWKKRVFEL